ncbi:MAG: O-antigen ligase family protein [Acidobacteriota bacterium]|nr:O-antigen ligase family protein [Acidobacteriota bacterium]
MNRQPATKDILQEPSAEASLRIAHLLSHAIYAASLALMILATIAYGGSDPWWKAVFTTAIFAVSIFAVLEIALSNNPRLPWVRVLWPVFLLVAFSLIQTVTLSHAAPGASGIQYPFWNSISADPYETRIFALQLLALALLAGLFYRYASTEPRLRRLIHVVIGLAVASAVFGLLRQTTQHQTGFGLPLLIPEQGYGQFINKNHFAYLMEMGMGLSLGLLAAGGVRRDRALIYLAVLLPMWTALVLSNSRGALLAMLAQLVITVLLFPEAVHDNGQSSGKAWAIIKSPAVRVGLVLSLGVLCIFGVLWVGGDRLATNIEGARIEFAAPEESRLGVTRLEIWEATLQLVKNNPIAGVGMGGYWAAIPRYHDASGSMTPQQAHNDYLELVASGGIIGVAIFVWFVVVVFRHARANLQSVDSFRRAATFAALIAITGVAVHSLVDFGLHRMANAMIFVALIVIATSKVSRDTKTQNENAAS